MHFCRTILLGSLLALTLRGPARAETVLFACSESCPLALFEALELELRGHGAFLVARLSPSGFTVEAHEADARRMGALMPAAAVLWVERESPMRVRVLAARQPAVREAPLPMPPEAIDPRVFAAIAGDVVLQAIAAPGHVESAAPDSPPPPPALPPAQAVTPAQTQTTPEAARASWPSKERAERPARFFLRAGAALGFAFLKPGMPSDRAPPSQLVNEALTELIANDGDPAIAKEVLAQGGYDCAIRPGGPPNSIVATDCTVALANSGTKFVPGIDVAGGVQVTERLALALTLRITPDAGYGQLNHALFGAQAEYTLTPPRSTGLWVNVGFGMGGGRIQVRPPSEVPHGPYVSSGPAYAQLLVGVGYRFLRHFGLYATPTARLLFPDQLWMFEPNLGVEGRL